MVTLRHETFFDFPTDNANLEENLAEFTFWNIYYCRYKQRKIKYNGNSFWKSSVTVISDLQSKNGATVILN